MQNIMLNLDGHSVFSPSSSEMWLNCSGSLLANMKVRQEGMDKGSEAAAEGTVAHEMAEIWLKTGKKPIDRIDDVIEVDGYSIVVTADMLGYVEEYVNWCNAQDGEKFVEVKVDFSHLMPVPNQKGTSDHVCISGNKLTITDLKYGMGVKVDAEHNTQLQIYALGALEEFGFIYDIKTVEMRICQPRLHHFSTWEITVEELLAFGEHVKKKAREAWFENAPRTVSEKGCMWCKVKATCPTMAKYVESAVDAAFDAVDESNESIINRIDKGEYLMQIPEVSDLSIEQLEKIYSKIKPVKSFFDEVEKKLFDFALKGGKMTAYKLVAGRTTRKWIDESVVHQFFADNGLDENTFNPRSLVSPAQAEKLCKANSIPLSDMDLLIASRIGKPTIAPIGDKRKEFVPNEDLADSVDWQD